MKAINNNFITINTSKKFQVTKLRKEREAPGKNRTKVNVKEGGEKMIKVAISGKKKDKGGGKWIHKD